MNHRILLLLLTGTATSAIIVAACGPGDSCEVTATCPVTEIPVDPAGTGGSDPTTTSQGAGPSSSSSSSATGGNGGAGGEGGAPPPPPLELDALAAGIGHTCRLRSDGTATCWGDNAFGQLGNGSTSSPSPPVNVVGLADASKLALGDSYSCAVVPSGEVRCWGRNNWGQLGVGDTLNTSAPSEPVVGVASIGTLKAARSHVCARNALNASIRCWGRNSGGSTGQGYTTFGCCSQQSPNCESCKVSVPVVIDLGELVAHLDSAGAYTTLALTASGTLWYWPSNDSMPDGTQTFPTDFPKASGITLTNVAQLQGYPSTRTEPEGCALLTDGTIKCWGGSNALGQHGDGTNTPVAGPVDVILDQPAVSMALGPESACAILEDRTVACWGSNSEGQLAQPLATTSSNVPLPVASVSNAVSLAAGQDGHVCVMEGDETVRCWGNNDRAQVGGAGENVTTPLVVSGL